MAAQMRITRWASIAWCCLGAGAVALWAAPADFELERFKPHLKAQTRIQQTYDQATLLLSERQFDAAIAQLSALVQTYPDQWRGWYMLANAYYAKGDYDGALVAAKQAVAQSAHTSTLGVTDQPGQQSYWLRANVYTAQSKWTHALKDFNAAVKLTPDHPGGYYQRGRFLINYWPTDPRAFRAAIADLNKALELGAPEAQTHGFLGMGYRKLKQLQKAEHHLRRVLELMPQSVDAIDQLVSMFDEFGEHAKADKILADFRAIAALSKPRDLAKLAMTEARHSIATGADPAVIDKHFRQALDAEPTASRSRLDYAHWLEKVDRHAEAVPILKAGLTEPPFDPDLAAQLAWAMVDTGGDLNKANQWITIARQRYPNDLYLADTAAWIQFGRGQYSTALQTLDKSLLLAEKVPDIAYHAGAIYAKLGKHTEAVRYLKMALRSPRSFTGRENAQAILKHLQTPVPG